MATPLNTIYSWFETGDFPTQAQFQASWSSFWHKDETIPMSKIDGLSEQFGRFVSTTSFGSHLSDENAHHLVLAKKDASNLNAANIISWKAALNVGELPANILTHDLGDEVGNGLTKQEIADQYLAKPETTVAFPNIINKWVALLTDAGDTVKMLAGDLGKNIANSKLVSVLNAGLDLGANWTLDTKGYLYKILGLADKSSDSTYSKFLGQDANGNVAIVGYGALRQVFTGLASNQALELGQLLNGGSGSDGALSVNAISPPIVQNRFNSVEYILLRGINLNLNVLSKKIEILSFDKTTVLVDIPDNQIQVNPSGIDLIFYYNFNNFPIGEYFIRITSGAKVFVTTISLKVVAQIENVNTSSITWETNYNKTPNPSDVVGGSSFSVFPPMVDSVSPLICLKSSEIFAEGEDFYLELRVLLTGAEQSLNKSSIGLGYFNVPNSLQNNSLAYSSFAGDYVHPSFIYRIYNNPNQVTSISSSSEYTVIFIKTGNLFRTIINGVNHNLTLSNNSGYSIFASLVGRSKSQTTVACQIMKAFKII